MNRQTFYTIEYNPRDQHQERCHLWPCSICLTMVQLQCMKQDSNLISILLKICHVNQNQPCPDLHFEPQERSWIKHSNLNVFLICPIQPYWHWHRWYSVATFAFLVKADLDKEAIHFGAFLCPSRVHFIKLAVQNYPLNTLQFKN